VASGRSEDCRRRVVTEGADTRLRWFWKGEEGEGGGGGRGCGTRRGEETDPDERMVARRKHFLMSPFGNITRRVCVCPPLKDYSNSNIAFNIYIALFNVLKDTLRHVIKTSLKSIP